MPTLLVRWSQVAFSFQNCVLFSSSMEQRESEIACHVKDSIQVAEAAIMEKDQVEIREKQLSAEVERLKTTLDLLVQEAGERTRKEVSSGPVLICLWCLLPCQ